MQMIYASSTNTKKQIKLKKQFNKDFGNICDWFADNKLSINFGEEKTKLTLFASKRRSKNIRQLKIRYSHIYIYKAAFASYISWVCVIRQNALWTNGTKDYEQDQLEIKISLQENRYFTKELDKMLCNALIHPHFDYACPAWYPNLNEKMKRECK